MWLVLIVKMPSCKTCFEKRLDVFTDLDTYKYKCCCDLNYTSMPSNLVHELPDGYPICSHEDSLEPPLSRNLSNQTHILQIL